MIRSKRLIISLCLVVILSLSFGVITLARTSNKPYPVNAKGQTYGSYSNNGISDELPVLIACKGVDGTEGYCYRSDLEGTLPKNPEEALKHMALLEENDYKRTVPLYESDGETVIGTFSIG